MLSHTILQAFLLTDYQSIQPIHSGLINSSYCVTLTGHQQFFLQKINTGIFKNPAALQENYAHIQQHLLAKGTFRLPAIVPAQNGILLYEHKGEAWRCFEYLQNTYSPAIAATAEKAYEVAHCFGLFTAGLQSLTTGSIQTVLLGFHNLQARYRQFTTAMASAQDTVLRKEKEIINEINSYHYLTEWYNAISNDKKEYPVHIMHHDCKIANILFDKTTNAIICPVDLDTTQPGLFFSDLGDMIRSMAPSLPEDAPNSGELELRTSFYDAIIQGYTDASPSLLTKSERADLHYSGLVLAYMQAIRFFTDHLNGNVYYKVAYPEQNGERTVNQLKLLALLAQYTRSVMKK